MTLAKQGRGSLGIKTLTELGRERLNKIELIIETKKKTGSIVGQLNPKGYFHSHKITKSNFYLNLSLKSPENLRIKPEIQRKKIVKAY